MNAFILDQERELDSSNDLLKTRVYANNLVSLIEKAPQDKAFTIGVFGGWGTGKSSIIKTAQKKIGKEGVKFITYDAWKYANDSFRRMFLLKVQQELEIQQTDEMMRFYQSETIEAKPKSKLSAKGLFLAGVVLLILSIVVIFILPKVKIEWKIAIPTLGTFLIALFNGCFYDLRLTVNKPTLFAPEQFEACFKKMMSKCLKQKKDDGKSDGDKNKIEKLIIVIDNIDRCPSDIAYQLLTDIKTFLSDEEYNLVFIVPVDDEALKKHLFRRSNKGIGDETNIDKEKDEFLRKIFNVTLRIKPHQETDLHHFAHEINTKNNLGYNNDTLAIVAKVFADNPRRIIQLLNNLNGELALYEKNFAEENETAICVALILREEYPDFYKETTKDLNIIYNSDKEDYNESLNAFMRVSCSIIKRTSPDALYRIFTNTSSIFNDLPDDIQKSVRTFDVDKVNEFANTNSEKKAILVDYAIESMKMDVQYGATSQTSQWIDFYCQLYKENIFDDSILHDINAILFLYYSTAIPHTNCPNELCYIAYKMEFLGMKELLDCITEYLESNKDQDDNANYVGIFRGYLSNLNSESDCNKIVNLVGNYYVKHPIDFDIAYTDTQKKLLFNDSFVTIQIENLTATDDSVHVENIIWCIKNNKGLSSDTYLLLFNKYCELFGDTRTRTTEDYLNLINQLLPVFEAIDTSTLTDQPQQLYHLVTADTRRVSILNELDEEQAKTVVSFCYEIMRISGGKVNVNDSITKLYSKCQETIIEGALKIHSLNISIQPLSTTLIDTENYDNQNVLSLLEVILSPQSDGNMMLDNDIIRNKINNLIDNVTNNNVEKLILKLAEDDQLLDIVTKYVSQLDSETINKLPTSVAKYAVTTFNKDTAGAYKDNVEFLILVLKHGDASQKKEVVRLMKDKIINEDDLDMVVKVLDHLVTDNKKMLENLVGELEEVKNSEKVEEVTKERISELIKKLSSLQKK